MVGDILRTAMGRISQYGSNRALLDNEVGHAERRDSQALETAAPLRDDPSGTLATVVAA
jgi:hypothetical protein